MAVFDPHDWESFFFGAMERDEASQLLAAAHVGSFLLRESRSKPGGYSLSVRECAEGDHQIYHYFIEKKEVEKDKFRYEICNNVFIDMASLLTYYRMHPLKFSCLAHPLARPAFCRVVALFKFDGERITDLPFERGEILDIIEQPEEAWWLARNALNITGLIPATYVKSYEDGDEISLLNPSTASSSDGSGEKRFSATSVASFSEEQQPPCSSLSLNGGPIGALTTAKTCSGGDSEKRVSANCAPAWVRVIADRFPSIYDGEALPLKQGQLLYLLEVLASGVCRGQSEADGSIGVFPFSYVEWTNIALDAGPWNPSNIS